MRFLVILSCLLLISCAGNFTAKHDNISINKNIRWLVTDDVDAYCRKSGLTPIFFQKIYGCAFWSYNECLIVTDKHTSHKTLGHELRHCFEGHFHD